MAEATRRVRIGVMVSRTHSGIPVDHLSGGRLEFGMGAGGSFGPTEHVQIGLEFPPTGERIRRLREACIVIKRLWPEEVADFQGRHTGWRGRSRSRSRCSGPTRCCGSAATVTS
jgi:alkanesulfonate monooxygenase SsuD/methylene tetrahydromethanopterin reductase-like flavin-dependent oxidoreductase (luciferase family)